MVKIPGYCPRCLHWTHTHGPDGCTYAGCPCTVGEDVLMGGIVEAD